MMKIVPFTEIKIFKAKTSNIIIIYLNKYLVYMIVFKEIFSNKLIIYLFKNNFYFNYEL